MIVLDGVCYIVFRRLIIILGAYFYYNLVLTIVVPLSEIFPQMISSGLDRRKLFFWQVW